MENIKIENTSFHLPLYTLLSPEYYRRLNLLFDIMKFDLCVGVLGKISSSRDEFHENGLNDILKYWRKLISTPLSIFHERFMPDYVQKFSLR